MRKPAMKALILAGLAVLQTAWLAEQASAYTLVDWIRTWPAYYAPAAAAVPVAPVYPAPAVTTPVTPLPSCTAPPTVTVPSSAAPTCGTPPPACGTAVPVVPTTQIAAAPVAPSPWCCLGFRREVRYRTTWTQVPTTNYRPVASYDPATCGATTTYLPCTTYTWQARRVPYTTMVWAPFASLFAAPTATPAYAYPVVTTPPATTFSVPDCGPSAPYSIAPQPTLAPGTSAPLGLPSPPAGVSVPATQPSVPATTIPTVPGPQSPATGAPATPADQPPNLLRSDGIQPIPEIRNYSTPPSGTPSLQGSSSNSFQPPAPAANGKVDLIPVPDPEARPRGKSSPVVPSLFDPRDRTAGRGVWPVSAVAPIAWPEKSSRQEARTATAEITAEKSLQGAPLDVNGWHAVRP